MIDDAEGYIDPAAEPFELVSVPQIGIDRYERMAALYNVLELSTAVDTGCSARSTSAGSSGLAYLDPDIRIFTPLTEIEDLLRQAAVASARNRADAEGRAQAERR